MLPLSVARQSAATPYTASRRFHSLSLIQLVSPLPQDGGHFHRTVNRTFSLTLNTPLPDGQREGRERACSFSTRVSWAKAQCTVSVQREGTKREQDVTVG
jgi:hypothetical protein